VKIARLSLLAWGHLKDVTLDLSAESSLFVVYGPNEAGKSTTRRAITSLLYGIDHKTPDAHTVPGAELRIGATLTSKHERIEVVRKKGRLRTLLDPAGEPIDEAVLGALLGGVGRETFETMFGLDHENLRQGGSSILEGKGDVGEALFAAGSGLVRTHELLRALRAEADEIFSPLARTKPLNLAIAAVDAASKRAREFAISPDKVREQEAYVDEARRARAALIAEQEALGAEYGEKQRLAAALHLFAERRALAGRVKELQVGPTLAEGAPLARERAEHTLRATQVRITRVEAEIRALAEQAAALPASDPSLASDPALAGLTHELATYLTRDIAATEERAGLAGHEATLADRVRKLGDGDVARARRIVKRAAGAQELAMEHSALVEKARRAKVELAEAKENVARAQAARAAAPEARPTEELAAALAAARRAGAIDEAIDRARAEEDAARRELERALGRLRGWGGSAEALASAKAPSDAAVAEAEAALAALADAERRHDEDARAIAEDADRAQRALDALVAERDVPSEADLALARAARDEIAAKVGKRGGPAAAEALAAIHAADAVVDRLRREADRVATRARLAADLASAARRRDDLAAMREKTRDERARFDAEWAEAWRPAGVTPEAPAAMRAWLQGRDAVARLLAAREEHRERATSLGERRQALAARLATAGGLAGSTAGEALADSVHLAEVELEARARAHAARAEAEKAHRDATAAEVKREAADREAEAELAAFRARWEAFAREAGLDPSSTAAEAATQVMLAADVAQADEDVSAARRRLEAHEAPMRAFEARVLELARAHAPELAERPAAEAARELVARHSAAKAAADVASGLAAQRAERERVLAEERDEHEGANADLAALLAEAHAEDRDALVRAEQRSADLRGVLAKLAEVEIAIATASGGADVDALEAACAATDRFTLLSRIDSIERRREELIDELASVSEKVGGLEAGLERLKAADAAHAQQDAVEASATARAHAERYVRLRLATELLAARVDRYRRENEAPIVGRAGELLAAITAGSLVGLKTSLGDDDTPVLVGLREGGREVPVAGMSDGARDALYLALRVASLERYAALRECPPLVLDDVLVHFDDDRAGAALEVLASLARKTQVLFFTHHARLVELARRCVPAAHLQVLEL